MENFYIFDSTQEIADKDEEYIFFALTVFSKIFRESKKSMTDILSTNLNFHFQPDNSDIKVKVTTKPKTIFIQIDSEASYAFSIESSYQPTLSKGEIGFALAELKNEGVSVESRVYS